MVLLYCLSLFTGVPEVGLCALKKSEGHALQALLCTITMPQSKPNFKRRQLGKVDGPSPMKVALFCWTF